MAEKLTLVFSARARQDLADILFWYVQNAPHMAEPWEYEMEVYIDFIASFPEAGQPVRKNVRKAVMKRFPYAIYYKTGTDLIEILAVYHGSRKPGGWENR